MLHPLTSLHLLLLATPSYLATPPYQATFSAELEKRVNTSELLQQQHLETLGGKVEQQARTLEAVLEGHAAQQDKYEQLLQWRVAANLTLALTLTPTLTTDSNPEPNPDPCP